MNGCVCVSDKRNLSWVYVETDQENMYHRIVSPHDQESAPRTRRCTHTHTHTHRYSQQSKIILLSCAVCRMWRDMSAMYNSYEYN